MSIQKITAALAIATIMGVSGTAMADLNGNPFEGAKAFNGSKMELIESGLSKHPEALDPTIFGKPAPDAETADFEKTEYTDDRV